MCCRRWLTTASGVASAAAPSFATPTAAVPSRPPPPTSAATRRADWTTSSGRGPTNGSIDPLAMRQTRRSSSFPSWPRGSTSPKTSTPSQPPALRLSSPVRPLPAHPEVPHLGYPIYFQRSLVTLMGTSLRTRFRVKDVVLNRFANLFSI